MSRSRACREIWTRLGVAGAVLGVAIVAAACSGAGGGGGSGPGVAALGSTTTTTAIAEVGGTVSMAVVYADSVRYATCMRAHGLPSFPDPNPQGVFPITPGKDGPGLPAMKTANSSCQHLLPNGGVTTPAEQQEQLAIGLKFVGCLHAHGEPNVPEPVEHGSGIALRIGGKGLDPRSPEFQRALHACEKYSNELAQIP